MNEKTALALSRHNGGFFTGHFVGTQGPQKGLGLHMPEYFDSRTLVTKPSVIWRLAQGIAAMLAEYDVDVVVGMPIGALTLGSDVAKLLKVDYAMAEKTTSGLVIGRSAFIDVVAGRRVALVEDTISKGDTIGQGVAAVKACGGRLIVVGGIINRGSVTARSLGLPLRALISRRLHMVTREECLASGQCSRREPINRKPGHGHDLERLIASGIIPADVRHSFV